ncbi:hypothetical protein AAEX28_07800 [Lentisphaerota bacterium WC36G]|nr:hypothetical protein LJT99_10655 [Lentisphaerae bacterium WC36]
MLIKKNKIYHFTMFISLLLQVSCQTKKEIKYQKNNDGKDIIYASKISFKEWLAEEKKSWLDKKTLINEINNAKSEKEEIYFLWLMHDQMKYNDINFVLSLYVNNRRVDLGEYTKQKNSNSNTYLLLEDCDEEGENYKLTLKNIKNIRILTLD